MTRAPMTKITLSHSVVIAFADSSSSSSSIDAFPDFFMSVPPSRDQLVAFDRAVSD